MQESLTEPKKASASPLARRKRTMLLFLAVLAGGAALGGGLWWSHAQAYETTDDAFIAGHVTTVSAQVAGRVRDVLVEDNQNAAVGEVLVRLDPDPFRVKLDQAKADLNEAGQKLQEARSRSLAARATVEQARADADSASAQMANAHTDLARYNRLITSGAVSQQARDNADTLSRTTTAGLTSARKRVAAAEAEAALAATQIDTAQAGVEKCRASVEQAALDLSYTEVKAHVSGRVTKKSVEPGDYVQAGQTLFSQVRDDVWVVANFKETQLRDMRPGQPVVFTVDAYPDREFKGHVDSFQAGTGAVFSLLPPQNASGNYVKVVQRVPVKIVFDRLPGESGLHLAPGMSVSPRVRVG